MRGVGQKMMMANKTFHADHNYIATYMQTLNRVLILRIYYIVYYTYLIVHHLMCTYLFPFQIDELIELMREGIRTNFTLYEKSLVSPFTPLGGSHSVYLIPHLAQIINRTCKITNDLFNVLVRF